MFKPYVTMAALLTLSACASNPSGVDWAHMNYAGNTTSTGDTCGDDITNCTVGRSRGSGGGHGRSSSSSHGRSR